MTEIIIDGLRVRLGGNEILKGVNLTIAQGQIVTLLGPSGSGKTTLLRAVAGLEQPSAGRIVLGGTSLFDGARGINLPPEARGLGLVFQSYALWPNKTVFENVAYPLKLRGVARPDIQARVARTLGGLGLDHLAERYPHQLSGGQQQRVALGRALVYEPSVILLDEPLSNLDAKMREEARVWLRQLITTHRLSALCVTHDQVEAMALADRVLLLQGGQIAQDGTPQEIYTRPNSLFVADFMGASNRFTGRIEAIADSRAEISVAGRRLGGRAHAGLCAGQDGVALIRLERVSWHLEPAADRLPMTLVDSLFLGDRFELLFDADGHMVRAFARDTPPRGLYHIALPAEDLLIYPCA